jgi:hypothetical protein
VPAKGRFEWSYVALLVPTLAPPGIGEYKFWNYQASHSEKASEWIA